MTPGDRFVEAIGAVGSLVFAAVCILTLLAPVIAGLAWLYFQLA